MINKIGFGGGCHWCTEAVFNHISGVNNVEQGWIRSYAPNDIFSEAVVVHYETELVSLEFLTRVHLASHSSTSNHSMRNKYQSAIYFINENDKSKLNRIMTRLKIETQKSYITQILRFSEFKINTEEYINYFDKNPDAPFCHTYIIPKLKLIQNKFGKENFVSENISL
jgi:peptide-methionine (S)-S-oxide reductase